MNRSAWQLHPYPNSRWTAEKALDGLKSDLSANGGQCTVSANYRTTAEWKVYLGGVFKIHHISIHYRTDNLQWSKIYFLFKHGICQFSVSFIFVGISFHFLKKICFIIYKWPEKCCTNLNFQFLNYEICYFIDLTKINFLLHLSWVMMIHVKVYGLNYHFS